MSKYKIRKIAELKELKKQEQELTVWIGKNISKAASDEFMSVFKKRNSLRHKINACKDRISDKHKKQLGYEELRIPTNIINNLNF